MRDALTQPPTEAMARAFAAKRGVSVDAAMRALAALREKQIAARRADPFANGYEPPIWYVVKALLRAAAVTDAERAFIERRHGLKWDDFAERIRARLGFAHPVGEVLVMGANRSGKTDFAAKLVMQTCREGNKSVNVGFQSLPTGKQIQMPRIWNYMPNDWKERNIAGRKSDNINEHISYTKQNGFSNSKITFANGSDVRFISYKADVTTNMEGSALDLCHLDEEFVKAFLDAARYRLASKRGTLLCTFTPVSGFTPVVADFLSDMDVRRWHTAWMLPIDGGEPMPWKELGLEKEEYERLVAWRDEGKGGDVGVPESRPEEIVERLLDPRAAVDIDEIPDGRAFGRTPRIGCCRGGEAAAVWFYGRDNPYGMPGEVIAKAMLNRNAVKEINCRVYGIAERIKGRMFPEFSRERNVISAAELPQRLVRVMVVDPAPERNWTIGWYGYDPAADVLYKYREWPGDYEIPGVGFPGPWAVASDRRSGINDGDKGPATEPFGFALLDYKFEWARLEGWRNAEEWIAAHSGERCRDWDLLAGWSEVDGTRERIAYRVVDARAAAQSKISMTENVSLFEDVSRLAEGFTPASGQRIDVGINLLRDRIASGRYKVVESCVNSIFAYETYCGADGQKGACKDPVDCDRYAVMSGICDWKVDDASGVEMSGTAPSTQHPAPGAKSRRRVWW